MLAAVTFGLAVVCFATCFVAGLWATHRAYGPLTRLNRLVEAMTAGDFTGRIQVRGSDDIRGLADRLNALADSLEGRPRRSEPAADVNSAAS
jgi:signal transduction histidine kinase